MRKPAFAGLLSSIAEAPTASTPGSAAGYDRFGWPCPAELPLPAAATTTTPAAIAFATAVSSSLAGVSAPRLKLMTFAPFDTALLIAVAISALEALLPPLGKTLKISSGAL